MIILGISCYYHDSAACLVKDGVLVAAAQEERFNRIKNSSDFPINAINYCVQRADISFNQIDYVAFYEKPYLKFSRVVQDVVAKFPFSYDAFIRNMPQWLQDRLILSAVLKREFAYKGDVFFIPHHHAHAASCFLISDFNEACIIINDGVGEFATSSIGYGKDKEIILNNQINYPDSLGLLYTTITTFLGFKANSGEGTTMALASFGNLSFAEQFEKIIQISEDGSYKLNQKYFSLNKRKRMYSKNLIKLLGEPRKPGTDYTQRDKDIAATLQHFIEKVLIRQAKYAYNSFKSPNLCLAGGVALNCVANQKIIEQTPFKHVFIQPGAGDAGAAIGAAFYTYNIILGKDRKFVMNHAYYGPTYSDKEIAIAINSNMLKSIKLENKELLDKVTDRIISNKTVGWFQGSLEFGPRALGNRSILASAQNVKMVEILNDRIKHREWFRPFAPIVKKEKAKEYFKMLDDSPFMLLAPEVLEDKKSLIPAVTHIDGTARTQTVDKEHNPLLWQLLDVHETKTGISVIINTSFNLKGEPIVCKPEEAINDFLNSDLDCLVLGNYFIEK
ncbi:MAG TPA: carbamoyltransferase N-terminal domain-containing protein [Bacteroidales bacterium]|nr:carbamoyltransferase N-terminal domain-containing protein [Bacteroidales bacterium]